MSKDRIVAIKAELQAIDQTLESLPAETLLGDRLIEHINGLIIELHVIYKAHNPVRYETWAKAR